MKNSNRCPKCQSDNIVRINGWTGAYGVGNNIPLKNSISSLFNPKKWKMPINVNRYVCCSCGFTEEWIDQEDLARLSESESAQKI